MSEWFLRFRATSREGGVNLFCLPHAGGCASAYFPWSRALPPFVNLWAVQLPGREGRIAEPAVTSAGRLSAQIVEAMMPLLGEPFALFGHSLGALLAFEIARTLSDRRLPTPVTLFLSGCGVPKPRRAAHPIHLLPDDDFLAEVRRFGGTPPEVLADAEMMSLVLPRLRADIELYESYSFSGGPPLAVPISVFGGLDDEEARRDELAGWARLTTGHFRLQLFPGDHFYLNSQRAALLRAIGGALQGSFDHEG